MLKKNTFEFYILDILNCWYCRTTQINLPEDVFDKSSCIGERVALRRTMNIIILNSLCGRIIAICYTTKAMIKIPSIGPNKLK